MSILKVARIGHPVVRTPAREVSEEEIRSPEVQRLIEDMIETMHEYDGVGLAAPQIHVSLRLAVIEVPDPGRPQGGQPRRPRGIHSREDGTTSTRPPEDAELDSEDARAETSVPLTVLLNPRVTPLGEEKRDGWEGCLSIPDLHGLVPRFARLRLEALDREGRPWSVEADGFFARVIQHECDHLDGRVYLDRMAGMRTLTFMREFERYVAPHEE
jgi:peptide deformylase